MCVGAKPNVPLAGWLKIVFKKCGWEKNKKHSVGNECRLTRCPFVISFLCLCSPVKMVYFFIVFSRLFVVVGSSVTLAANAHQLYAVQVFEKQIFNQALLQAIGV